MVLAATLAGAAAACSSAGSSSAEGCTPAAGAYLLHYSSTSDAGMCPSIPDETVSFSASEGPMTMTRLMTTTGGTDGGSECSSTQTLCSFAYSCVEAVPDADPSEAFAMSGSITYSASGATGTWSLATTLAGVLSRCNYTFTLSRQ
jgi:hypothetical protein